MLFVWCIQFSFYQRSHHRKRSPVHCIRNTFKRPSSLILYKGFFKSVWFQVHYFICFRITKFRCSHLFVSSSGARLLPFSEDYFKSCQTAMKGLLCESSSRLKIVNNWCERIWAIKYPRVYQMLRGFLIQVSNCWPNRTTDLKTGNYFISFKSYLDNGIMWLNVAERKKFSFALLIDNRSFISKDLAFASLDKMYKICTITWSGAGRGF